MTDTTELNDLEGVTQHPGWHRVMALFDAEWGVAGQRYIATLNRIAKQPMEKQQDRDQALQDMQVVIKAQEAMHSFWAQVQGRVRQLQNQSVPVEAPQSRRGML